MKKPTIAVTMCSLLFATGALAQTVKVNWQIDAPFADYRTYAWKESNNEGGPFYQQWTQKDVDTTLSEKGLRSVAAGEDPDLYVYYHVITQEVIDSTTTDDGFGWGGGRWGHWGGWGGPDITQTEARPRTIGILGVDLIDVKKKQMVWRGSGNGRHDLQHPERRRRTSSEIGRQDVQAIPTKREVAHKNRLKEGL